MNMITYRKGREAWELHMHEHTSQDLTYTPEFIEYQEMPGNRLRVSAEYDIQGPLPEALVEIIADTAIDVMEISKGIISEGHEPVTQFEDVIVAETDPGQPYITPLNVDGIVMETGHIVLVFEVDLLTRSFKIVETFFDRTFNSTITIHYALVSTSDDVNETHTCDLSSYANTWMSDFLAHTNVLSLGEHLFEVIRLE